MRGIQYAVPFVGIETAAFTGSSAFADDDSCGNWHPAGLAGQPSSQQFIPAHRCKFRSASYDGYHV